MKTVELIKKDLQNKKDIWGRPMIDAIVVLKKDDKGYYIEYAFKEGAPHDNRCLSWYDSYQEEAYIRNGWVDGLSDEEARKRLDEKIDVYQKMTSESTRFLSQPRDRIKMFTIWLPFRLRPCSLSSVHPCRAHRWQPQGASFPWGL